MMDDSGRRTFRPLDPNDLKVEGKDGEVYRATSAGQCACGKTNCEHLEYAERLWKKDRDLYFLAKSGLHKELRRGDESRAAGFARILEFYRPGEARRYMRSIFHEETRNLDLLKKCYDGTPLNEIIHYFARSVKDWELSWDVGCCSPEWFITDSQLKLGDPEKNPVISMTPKELYVWTQALTRREFYDKLYTMIVAMGLDRGETQRIKDAKESVKPVLIHEAAKRCPRFGRTIAKHITYSNDSFSLLYMIISGRYQEEACEYKPSSLYYEADLPFIGDYVYDIHTRAGRKRINRHKNQIDWGKPMPDSIDLRWSGSFAGTFWRYLCFRERGTLDVPWEKIQPGDKLKAAFQTVEGDVA